MNQTKGLRIYNIPTRKLVIMVDVSKGQLNKLLKKQKSEDEPSEELDKKVELWKNRYLVSSAELRRRVNDQFNKIDSEHNLKE